MATLTRQADGSLQVGGALVFDSVSELLEPGCELFAPGVELLFDLSAVERCDSAALALLLEWLARAEAQGTRLRFRALPEALRGIARLSGALALLPLEEETG